MMQSFHEEEHPPIPLPEKIVSDEQLWCCKLHLMPDSVKEDTTGGQIILEAPFC